MSSILRDAPGDSTPLKAESAFDPFFGSTSRSTLATTASALKGSPLLNVTPGRSLNVQTEPSALGDQLVASTGSSV